MEEDLRPTSSNGMHTYSFPLCLFHIVSSFSTFSPPPNGFIWPNNHHNGLPTNR